MSLDMMTGMSVYGDQYPIACTWVSKTQQVRDKNGAEFISEYEIYTESALPAYLDEISIDGGVTWQEIRSVTQWDMSFFGETPDYKLVT